MPKALSENLQKYVRRTERTWNQRHPSEKTIEEHFDYIRTEAKRAENTEVLDAIDDFTEESRIHFQELFSRKDKSLNKLKDEFEETKKEIAERYKHVECFTTKKEIGIKVGTDGVGFDVKKERQPRIPKDVDTT